MEIRDGGTPDSPLVGRYCGQDLPPNYASTGNQLFIKFRTDVSINHAGFRAEYEAGKKPK